MLGAWDVYEITTERAWIRGVALGVGVLVVAGLQLVGVL